jgi:hypothetical protein
MQFFFQSALSSFLKMPSKHHNEPWNLQALRKRSPSSPAYAPRRNLNTGGIKRARQSPSTSYSLRGSNTLDMATVCSGTDSFAAGSMLVSEFLYGADERDSFNIFLNQCHCAD